MSNKFQPINIPNTKHGKLFIYFKNYIKKDIEEQNLEDILKNPGKKNQIEKKQIEDFPEKKTLYIVNFQANFDEEQLKQWFRIHGKIKKISIGQFKQKGQKQQNQILIEYFLLYYAINMRLNISRPKLMKCKIQIEVLSINLELNDQNYKEQIVENLLDEKIDKKKQNFINQMTDDGFTLVTNHNDDVPDYDQEKETKPKKKQRTYNNLYKFQVQNNNYESQLKDEDSEDNQINEWDFLRVKKVKLARQFEKDRQQLLNNRN